MSSWDDVGSCLLGSWPMLVAKWGRDAIAAYIGELQARGLSPESALVVLRSWRETWPPTASEAAELGRQDPSLPTSEEALTLLHRVVKAPGFAERLRAHYKTTGSTVIGGEMEARLREECVIAALAECHPMIQSFAVAQGLTRLERLVSATGDEEWGELRVKELREAWDRHRDAGETRQVAVLAAGRPDDLRRLDPLAGLQHPAPALTSGQPSEGGSEQ